jgi:transcriptional regulator with XRE-family HTH domain
MALGAILRTAREGKGLTPQQVAETTRMMVQIVEDLEQEDFRKIAAPLYGRGFIKLYAECVGVDPEPLVAEFIEIFTGKRPPQILRRAIPSPPAPASLLIVTRMCTPRRCSCAP